MTPDKTTIKDRFSCTRRFRVLFCALAAGTLLSGCGQGFLQNPFTKEEKNSNGAPEGVVVEDLPEEVPDKESAKEAVRIPSVSDQTLLMTGQTDTWMDGSFYSSLASYAVTDINNNGFYEIMRGYSYEGGTSVQFFVWEVTPGDDSTSMEPLLSCQVNTSGGSREVEWYTDHNELGIGRNIILQAAESYYGQETAGDAQFQWIRNMELLSGDASRVESALCSSAEQFVYDGNDPYGTGEDEQVAVSDKPGMSRSKTYYSVYNDDANRLLCYLQYDQLTPDSGTQRRYPALTAAIDELNLSSCRDEESRQALGTAVKEAYDNGEDAETISEIVGLNPHRMDDQAVSIEVNVNSNAPVSYEFAGSTYGVSFDTNTGEEIRIRDLVTDTRALSGPIFEKLKSLYSYIMFDDNAENTISQYCSVGGGSLSFLLENNGITFYFGAGVLCGEENGTLSCMLTDSELGELRTEAYREAPAAYTVYPQMDEPFYMDIDADGSADRIVITQSGDRQSIHGQATVWVNGESLGDSIKFYTAHPVCMKLENGSVYIYTEYIRDEDDRTIHIYNLGNSDGISLHYAGSSNFGLPSEEDDSGRKLEVIITDPSALSLECHFNLLSTFEGRRDCSIGEDGMPLFTNEIYTIHDAPVLFAKDGLFLDVVNPSTGQIRGQRRISAGERLTFKETDGGSYIDLLLDGGITVRIYPNNSTQFNDWLNVYDYFSNVVFKD